MNHLDRQVKQDAITNTRSITTGETTNKFSTIRERQSTNAINKVESNEALINIIPALCSHLQDRARPFTEAVYCKVAMLGLGLTWTE